MSYASAATDGRKAKERPQEQKKRDFLKNKERIHFG